MYLGGGGQPQNVSKIVSEEVSKKKSLTNILTYSPTNFKKAAFTLAEVLITLGIIGIIAALTMPGLIAKYKKNQTVTQLKKAYSEINQAIRLSEAKYGTLDTWDFSDMTNASERDKYFAENYLFSNIKAVKKCVPSSNDCFGQVYTLDNVSTFITGDNPEDMSFITASGYSVYFWIHGAGNGGWFYIDINGPRKGSNALGVDVFPFLMSWGNSQREGSADNECTKNLGFMPVGLDCNTKQPSRDDLINGTGGLDFPRMACKKGSGLRGAGGYCGALIMYDGWEIKDDYPW